MWYAIAAIAVVVVAALIVRVRNATPSVAMFRAIDRGIQDVQRNAFHNVLPDRKGEIRCFDEEAMRNQMLVLNETIRFVYTVEQRDSGFVHLVSSQLKRPKGEKYQVECMLVVMLVLNRQLAQVGIKQDEVKFEIQKSELGTHYVAMLLNTEQHERLAAGLATAA
jgi:hypothetical protein